MNKSIFIKQLDHPAIEAAIAQAEKVTSGEIRIAVMHEPTGNPVAKAKEVFLAMNMAKTKRRNAILILIAPSSQTFAIVGDEGVHEKCGRDFWQELVTAMSGHFKRGDFTAGLKQGIERAGALLTEHFPHQADDENELPDKVIE